MADRPSPSPTNAHVGSHLAEALSIGDELLSGDTTNTNATFLGQRARALGLVLRHVATVRDRHEEIVAAVRAAALRADVLLVSGGLGPTTDDLTTRAVADAAGRAIALDPEALARLADKFRSFARAMPEANHKQAELPEGAEWLPNPIGTAEGFALELGRCVVFVMPGVPRELRRMTLEQVEPRLAHRLALQPAVRRVYRLLGIGESAVAERVEPIVAAARTRSAGLAALFLHYRAAMPEVTVILEGTRDAEGHAAEAHELAALDAELVPALAASSAAGRGAGSAAGRGAGSAAGRGAGIYGIGEADLPSRVIAALQRAGKRLAAAESCTGGLASALLTAVPGASTCFDGGVVAYHDGIKQALLGVDAALLAEHGAVSEPVARAMAEGARRSLGSDLAFGITGIAGPGGGTVEKPVGLVHIAVADAERTSHLRLQLRGDRGIVQRSAALWAVKLVWDRLHDAGLAAIEAYEPPALE